MLGPETPIRQVAGQNSLGAWDFDALPAWTCAMHRLAAFPPTICAVPVQ